MENPKVIESEEIDPWSLFIYAMKAPMTRDRYQTRVAKFFDFIGITGNRLEDRARTFAERGKNDSNWTFSNIVKFVQFHNGRLLEKMNKKDQTSLLNLMESGILSELKHNPQRTTQLKTWVFASCNSTDKLLPPLLTRFRDIHFKPYTEEEFVEIVVNVLDREEGVDRDIALLIANGVYNRLKSSNLRECVRIARLARNDASEVNRIIGTFAKYGIEMINNKM